MLISHQLIAPYHLSHHLNARLNHPRLENLTNVPYFLIIADGPDPEDHILYRKTLDFSVQLILS